MLRISLCSWDPPASNKERLLQVQQHFKSEWAPLQTVNWTNLSSENCAFILPASAISYAKELLELFELMDLGAPWSSEILPLNGRMVILQNWYWSQQNSQKWLEAAESANALKWGEEMSENAMKKNLRVRGRMS